MFNTQIALCLSFKIWKTFYNVLLIYDKRYLNVIQPDWRMAARNSTPRSFLYTHTVDQSDDGGVKFKLN